MQINKLSMKKIILIAAAALLSISCADYHDFYEKYKNYSRLTDVADFQAQAGNSQVHLSWTNPSFTQFAGVKILRKIGSYPSDKTDGVSVYDGKNSSYVDDGLTNGETYYYKIFAYDVSNNFSTGVTGVAMPSAGNVNAPTFSPGTGVYNSAQNVTISSTTADAVVCYSTGTDPACNAAKDGCTTGTKYASTVNVSTTTTLKAMACKVGYTDSGVASATYTIDTTAPTLTSHTPAHNATNVVPCSGSPCRGTIKLVFSESMDTSQTSHTLSTAIWDSNISNYVSAPNTTLAGIWSQTTVANDTLTIPISWLHWPANSKIQWSLATAALKDAAGNALSGTIDNKIFTTTTRNIVYPVGDTGQTLCYNDSAAISCADSSWPFQDADFTNTPNARSFAGPTAHVTYTSDYTTTDNVTGLVWKTCTQGQSGSNCQGTGTSGDNYGANNVKPTWVIALDTCCALNTANSGAGYAGRTDWRLPTPEELETLPNYGNSNPAIDTSSFPATVSSSYWSSSTYVNDAKYAWRVYFGYGSVPYNDKTDSYYVRCVSGGNASPRSYTNNGDGTVKDNVTGLVWQKCSKGQNNDATCTDTVTTANWQTALQYCKDLTLGGRTWRLPSIKELKSLADSSRSNPAIETSFFPATVSSNYWSSSTYVYNATYAWNVNFNNGYVSYDSFKTDSNYVRCVSGP